MSKVKKEESFMTFIRKMSDSVYGNTFLWFITFLVIYAVDEVYLYMAVLVIFLMEAYDTIKLRFFYEKHKDYLKQKFKPDFVKDIVIGTVVFCGLLIYLNMYISAVLYFLFELFQLSNNIYYKDKYYREEK